MLFVSHIAAENAGDRPYVLTPTFNGAYCGSYDDDLAYINKMATMYLGEEAGKTFELAHVNNSMHDAITKHGYFDNPNLWKFLARLDLYHIDLVLPIELIEPPVFVYGGINCDGMKLVRVSSKDKSILDENNIRYCTISYGDSSLYVLTGNEAQLMVLDLLGGVSNYVFKIVEIDDDPILQILPHCTCPCTLVFGPENINA